MNAFMHLYLVYIYHVNWVYIYKCCIITIHIFQISQKKTHSHHSHTHPPELPDHIWYLHRVWSILCFSEPVPHTGTRMNLNATAATPHLVAGLACYEQTVGCMETWNLNQLLFRWLHFKSKKKITEKSTRTSTWSPPQRISLGSKNLGVRPKVYCTV